MLLTLEQLAQLDPEQRRAVAGGKGAALAGLVADALPVPAAVVVPIQALRRHLHAGRLWSRARAGEDVSAEVLSRPLDPRLSSALQQAARDLLGMSSALLAVRSSGADEDGNTSSFAGQYRTLLGLSGGDALERAVRECWASAWSPAAATYRKARRGGHRVPSMAVVVQVLVEPRCAGVLFTVNPANGSWREMTVEAAWGQGEAVVSGAVVPEFHRVRRPRRTPRPVQRVLARVRLEPLEHVPAQQTRRYVADPAHPGGNLVAESLPAELRSQRCLERRQLLALCRLGLRIEARRGGPVDIEWAVDPAGKLWVLQARPVTAGTDVRRAGPTVWTRRFVGERWTVPATPLGWSLMRELLEWFIAYPETSRRYLGGASPTRLVRFAPYFDVTVFRHLAFKLPGFSPPRFMVELLPPQEEQGWLRRRAAPPDLRVYASIFRETIVERRWERFRWNLFANDRAWEELVPRLDNALDELAAPIDRRTEALARTEVCLGLAREYVKVHICSLLFANIWYQLAGASLDAADLGGLAADLLQPPHDSLTARTNRDLWRLGRGELPLDVFLEAYGHRADGSWELFTPRWREDATQLLALAKTVSTGPDPALAAAAATRRTTAALDQVNGLPRQLTDLARRYLALREDQRFWFDRITWEWKRAWLWLEQDTGCSLRFLEAGEVRALLDGELDRAAADAIIVRRSAEWEEECQRRADGDEPPVFLVGEDAVVAVDAPGDRIDGMGISPGVVTGTARIVRTLADAHRLRPGDVLVTRTTDPAWTPLFLNARGLVMEIGGMLSHGAVVAREYRLPAVVNVRDATRRIQDGQTITIDGSRGRVWVH